MNASNTLESKQLANEYMNHFLRMAPMALIQPFVMANAWDFKDTANFQSTTNYELQLQQTLRPGRAQ